MIQRRVQTNFFPPREIRRLIQETLPEETDTHGEPPKYGFLYVPTAHVRALHPDSMLVVGTRGAGKSVWWAALQDPDYRKLVVAQTTRTAPFDDNTIVSPGFGVRKNPRDYPDKEIFRKLIGIYEPELIWRTIITWHVTGKEDGLLRHTKAWEERVGWILQHPEETSHALFDADRKLADKKQQHLIVFDALDRTASTWNDLKSLLRGLLQAALDFRSFYSLRAKAFVRPDMLDDPEVSSFPDASKVLSSRVSLDWPRADLYGLLWQHLSNGQRFGRAFRDRCNNIFGLTWREFMGVWRVPSELRKNEETQRSVFHAIASPYMGKDQRRGAAYTWLPNHLADAHKKVSPRSFLSAIRTAALSDTNSNKDVPIFYEAIKLGVQEASKIRVKEIQEDHKWIGIAMKPLRDLVIPCDFTDVYRRWKEADVISELQRHRDIRPKRLDRGFAGVREDLLELGVFEQMPDGRINMPDVYRVGFGLKRKGGIKPIR
ncbi:hypothetical protein [Hyalangium rubrum]|uniref:Uncharacterized protein n=1 Tax=Hyalangium rubrum TaxID=3103134 RepID=A0ABU5H562_9BACT|nr:hypothetical protein [Hyalangium sp. s54d21]MDY7228638.1 hypothetical protein [Hyalangium sp. s54d21]